MVQGFEETAYLQPFEKNGIDIAVCVRAESGIGSNALLIYAYDETKKQWTERVYWDTESRGSNEVIGVNVAFDKQSGIIESRSGEGHCIFRANVGALAPKQPEEVFTEGSGTTNFPPFHTLEGLKASAERDGRLYVFEKDDGKVAVCEQPWGTRRWKGIVLYTWNKVAGLWCPRVIWDTGQTEVRVTFDNSTGIIEVRSRGGTLVFETNITALKARQVPWGW
jgi:hypothetical protein